MFVTLTYPKDFPMTGGEVKRHLKLLRQRWARRWGKRIYAVWKMEFQKRGAAHFHLAISAPQAEKQLVRNWLSRAWYEVVGSGDPRHLAAGTQYVQWRSSVGRYLSGYCAKDKRYQNVAPEDFEGMGRWWGVWGGQDKDGPARVWWDGKKLRVDEAAEAHRLMRRYRASQARIDDHRKRHQCRRTMAKAPTLWVVGGNRTDALANAILGAAQSIAAYKAWQ